MAGREAAALTTQINLAQNVEMNGAITIQPGSRYEDSFERYHFPSQYARQAEALVGGWVVHHRSRRGGVAPCYEGVSRFATIEPDPQQAGHAFAQLRDYLAFDVPVPLKRPSGRYYESELEAAGSRVGAALRGRSLRSLRDADFASIVRDGLAETLDTANEVLLDLDQELDPEARALLRLDPSEQERRIESVLVNRPSEAPAFAATYAPHTITPAR